MALWRPSRIRWRLPLSTDLILAEHGEDWTTALLIHDLSGSSTGISRSLQHLRCHHLLAAYSSLNPQAHTSEQQSETAWRNAQWDAPVPSPHSPLPAAGFHSHLYAALIAVRSSASPTAALSAARLVLVEAVNEVNPELVREVVPLLVRFQMLSTVSASTASSTLRQSSHTSDAFDLVEPLLALHSTLQSILQAPLSAVVPHLCYASSLARAAASPLIAAHYIRSAALQIQAVPNLPRHLSMQVQVCHAEMLYSRGRVEGAIRELKAVLSRLESAELSEQLSDSSPMRMLEVDVFAHLGEWLSESHSESSERIGRYFEQALRSASNLSQSTPPSSPSLPSSSLVPSFHERYAVSAHHFALGTFHDRQFQCLLSRRRSSEWKERRVHFQRQGEGIVEGQEEAADGRGARHPRAEGPEGRALPRPQAAGEAATTTGEGARAG